ncbi:MAG: transketolase [Oligoflexia bacterium]|nr:transketolase [Oligoflexia bacterium]
MSMLSYIPFEEFKRIEKSKNNLVEYISLFSDLCRINVLYMIKKVGSGHIGSSFSSIDIVSTLYLSHLNYNNDPLKIYDQDIYFSSKGHDVPGFYSVLIGLGLIDFKMLHQLRRLEGLPGHPDISTPFIATNTGSLGMGISKAKGFIRAKKMNSQDGRVYVLVGDGELQEGQFWESLQSVATSHLNNITIIIDHNKVQSDKLIENVLSLGNLEDKLKAFGFFVVICNGHSITDIESALKEQTSDNKAKIIIANTIKGQGVSFMEHTSMPANQLYYQYHSGSPNDLEYENAVTELMSSINKKCKILNLSPVSLTSAELVTKIPLTNKQSLVEAYSREILNHGKANSKIVALNADLVKDTGLIPFSEQLPKQFIECGIAEQDMVSQAGTLALMEHIPCVHSFACFLTTRAAEQIYNNVSEKTKIIYSGFLAGLLPSGPGHSHQSVRDIGIMANIPNMTIIQPASEKEVELALNYALNINKFNTYLRIASIPFEKVSSPYESYFHPGRGYVVKDGKDAALFTYGPTMLSEALKASDIVLKEKGIRIKIVNMPWLNLIDREWLENILNGIDIIFTLDDHFLRGGFGEFLSYKLFEFKMNKKIKIFKSFGLQDIPACGNSDEVLRIHELDALSIANKMH